MNNKIIFNGKEYNSVEEMPPEARQAYENAMGQFNNMFADADQDGMPDIFENLTTGNIPNAQVFSTSKIIFNGQAYDSVDEMPLEARQKYEQAFQDKNRDGVPDVFEQLGHTNVVQPAPTTHSKFPAPTNSVHQSEGISPTVWLVVAGLVILFLLLVIVGLLFIILR